MSSYDYEKHDVKIMDRSENLNRSKRLHSFQVRR